MIEIHFTLTTLHIRIVSFLFCLHISIPQSERIYSIRSHIRYMGSKRSLLSHPLPIGQRWSHPSERTTFDIGAKQIIMLVERWAFRFYGKNTCRGIMPCTLHLVVNLSDRERQLREEIRRVSTNIHLSCLCIANSYTIITHHRMMSTQISHRNGFHSTDTTIVAHIRTSEFLHRISQRDDSQTIQLVLIHHLHGRRGQYIFVHGMRAHFYLLYRMHLVYDRIRLCKHTTCYHKQ